MSTGRTALITGDSAGIGGLRLEAWEFLGDVPIADPDIIAAVIERGRFV
jgi:hypothetical protein